MKKIFSSKLSLLIGSLVLATIISFVSCDDVSPHIHTEVIDAAVDATCTETGLTEGKHCSVCNEIILSQTVIDAIGHSEVIDEVVFPTCESVGLTGGKHCSACGEIFVAQDEISKIDCLYTWHYDKSPTKTEDGLRTNKCVWCGDILETEILYAGSQNLTYGENDDGTYYVKGINYNSSDGEIVIPKKYKDKPVTGIGSNLLNGSIVSITIHEDITYISNDAFVCDIYPIYPYRLTKFIVDADNPNYSSIDGHLYSKDGKVLIRYAPANESSAFTVPDHVTTINKYAFGNSKSLLHVYLPEGVISIGDYAFTQCSNLENISLPNSLASVGQGAFTDCKSLETIVFADGLTHIGNYAFQHCISLKSVTFPNGLTSIPDGIFFSCEALENVDIPSSITSIGDSSFLACYSIKNIEIPSGLTFIGESAFYLCSSLQSITVPSSVTHIGSYAFYECRSIESFNVDPENEYFESVDGNLYEIESKTLLNYAIGKKDVLFTVPDGVLGIAYEAFFNCDTIEKIIISDSVTWIGEGAFERCDSLKSVIIGNGILDIPDSAFSMCNSLEEVFIPSSVITLGKYAFNWCGNLAIINFSGTINQWLAVKKNEHFDDLTPNYTVYCTDGEVDSNGTVM